MAPTEDKQEVAEELMGGEALDFHHRHHHRYADRSASSGEQVPA
ncbi:methylthioadenosine nucleosidase 1 [Actinidia rufa]|uniref:Methylthioadenosine nucleosidase 1 n=1 Tax=Actinidia rufa TaxID=165716 RepID=A0A7J0FPJ2_9ERIC|nr:methylthioadenosine nucleosidase 1 [Actinidia rufa]